MSEFSQKPIVESRNLNSIKWQCMFVLPREQVNSKIVLQWRLYSEFSEAGNLRFRYGQKFSAFPDSETHLVSLRFERRWGRTDLCWNNGVFVWWARWLRTKEKREVPVPESWILLFTGWVAWSCVSYCIMLQTGTFPTVADAPWYNSSGEIYFSQDRIQIVTPKALQLTL